MFKLHNKAVQFFLDTTDLNRDNLTNLAFVFVYTEFLQARY